MDVEGTVLGFEVECRREDGAVISVEENAHAIRDSGGSVLPYKGSA